MTTKERLDELLALDLAAGHFTRKVSRGGNRAGTIAGTLDARGYIKIQIDGKYYSAHRLIFFMMTGHWPEGEIDHINGDRSDNRWRNLREATPAENSRNRRTTARNTSGVPGVYWDAASGKWRAQIQVNRKKINLGYFTEFEDAVAARRAAEVKYFGEFSATASRPAPRALTRIARLGNTGRATNHRDRPRTFRRLGMG
jgi:hypothetical protein